MGTASADPRVVVHGRVVDGSGRPIANAKVTVEGAAAIATTGVDGSFTLDAPAGASLIVEHAGFGVGLATAPRAGGTSHVDDVVLLAEETIEIEDNAPVEAPGETRISRERLHRIAGTGNDVVRSLSAMPGVANYPLPLGRSGVVIRGSSPQDSKLLVDDFEVPSIYHDLGFRSIVPVEAIDSLEYIPGGFDVSYGRATSGIASLTTRAGQDKRTEQVELSAGELGTLAQGSTEHARYTFAVRRSMIDLILPHVLPDDLDLTLATVPRYYDEQIRVDRELSPTWSLRLSSLGSDDVLEVYGSQQRDPDKRLYDRKRFVRMTAAARYHDGPWSGTLALSGIDQQFVVERGQYQHISVTAPAVTSRAEFIRSADRAAGLRDLAWKTGGELVTTRYTLDVAWPRDPREGEPIEPDDGMDVSQRFDGAVVTNNAAAWTSLGANLDPRIRATVGVRVDAYTRNHDVAVQPRGELAVKLAPKLVARFSAGAYSRPPEHDGELLEASLQGERSTQLIAGVAYEPAEGLRVQASAYYTDRRKLIGHTGDMLVNSGRGTTTGAEVLATLDRGPWFGWVGYAYSHSTRVDQPGAEPRLFDFDQPHDLNLCASYRMGKWTLGGRFRIASGMPQTPVRTALFDSDANVYFPVYGPVNSERTPMHHQLDLRIDKSWRWGPVKMTKFIDIQNVYLNDSAVAYFYNFDYSQRGAFKMIPIIPTAGLRGEY